jgi:Immunoglobulin domain
MFRVDTHASLRDNQISRPSGDHDCFNGRASPATKLMKTALTQLILILCKMSRSALLLSLVWSIGQQAEAATVTLRPVADTTVFQTYPNNNFGHYYLVAGTTAKQGERSRALFKFSPGTNIAPGAIISSVQLAFQVNRAPHTAQSSTFDVCRMLVDWGEGTGGSGSKTMGSPAKTNESTWDARFFPSTLWSAPGASAPVDFVATPSASKLLAGQTLAFSSTPQLIADVQGWVDHPDTNFGWILISESESLEETARRFGSREFPSIAPTLVVTFTAGAPQTLPEITSQPQDQVVYAGDAATFNVIASGTPPLSYLWSLNLAGLTGATNAALILTNVQTANAGSYTVTISNAAGSVVSAPATLTLATAPVIQPVTLTGGVLELNFAAQAGHNYLLQFVGSLPATNWQTLTNISAPAFATNVLVLDPVSSSQRFYRLEALQAP